MSKIREQFFLGIMIFMATTVGVFAHPQNPYLKSLTVNGEPVEGFNKNKSVYIHEITREDCCKPIPTVEAVVDDPTSTVTITQATSLPGEARILVHAIDVYEMGYVVKFNYKRSKIKDMAPVELSVKKGLELYRAPVPQRMIVTLDSGIIAKTPVVWNYDEYDLSKTVPQIVTGKLLPEADYNMKITKNDIPKLIVTQRPVQKEFYVSPNGNDGNPGSLAKPFATIARAQREVRKHNADMTGDIIVYLRGGVYEFTEPMQFDVSDSGTNGFYVVYQNYAAELPEINGGKVLDAKWEKDPQRKGVYKTTLTREKKLRILYVDGKPAKMTEKTVRGQGHVGEFEVTGKEFWAETPGNTWAGFKVKVSDVQVYANQRDVEIKQSRVWNSSIVGIEKIYQDGDYVIFEPQQPYGAIYSRMNWGCNINCDNRNVVIRNMLEELNKPGQFYFDRATNMLYYYPEKGSDINSSKFIVPVSQGLLCIKGQSLDKRVENIEFSGIRFCNDDYNLESIDDPARGLHSEGFGGVQNLALYTKYRQDGDWHQSWYNNTDLPTMTVDVESAKGIIFESNQFVSLATPCSVGFVNDVTNSVVKGCLFEDTAGNTVSVGHPQHVYIGKDEKSDQQKYPIDVEGVCKEVQVVNCLARNVSAEFYQADALVGFFVEDCDFSYNDIANVPYSGMSIGWGWVNFKGKGASQRVVTDAPTLVAKDNRIMFNKLGETHSKLNDGGTLYVLGYQPRTIIAYNYIYRGTRSIYPDQGSEGFSIHHNMLENPKGNWLNSWYWPNEKPIIFDNISSDNYVCGKDLRVDRYVPGNPVFNTHYEIPGDYSPEAQAIIDNAGIGQYSSSYLPAEF